MAQITVLGGGESGVGAALLAEKKGFEVFLSDRGKLKETFRNVLSNTGIKWEEGKHSLDEILKAQTVVKSPGIPDDAEIVRKCLEAGIEVISEIEFAFRHSTGKVVAVTGSNGKTTTATLIQHILQTAGWNSALVGNVGKSFARQVSEEDKPWYVIEVSSFQLDGIVKFRPDVAILLNITPDHLDRYGNDFDRYRASKFRITQNQEENDVFIYCDDDQAILEGLKAFQPRAKKYPFSIEHPVNRGADLDEEKLRIRTNTKPLTMSIKDLALQGKHNVYNSMAASIAARVLEIRKEVVRDSLSDFQNVEHRLEYVGEIHGISFINDSKATNVNSTWFALETQDHPVIWIVGGVDKGNDYRMLLPLVKDKVKAIVCLGKDNKKIIDFFGEHVEDIVEAQSAQDAVNFSYRLGKKGDVVLLSPACASFDLFENYEERGQKFKAAVRAL